VLVFLTRAEVGEAPSGALTLYFDLDPLILLATWLSTHALTGLSLLALITLAVTIVLGRVFCGWFCPFGVLHQIMTWLRSRTRKGRPHHELSSPWQRAKYLVLIALLIMALFGAQWIGVLDPFSMLYRSLVTAVLPAFQWIIEAGANAIYDADPHLGDAHLSDLTDVVYESATDHLFAGARQLFTGAGLIFAIFVATLLLNFWRPRFWCRYVCPLGALLGLFARRSMLRLQQEDSACNDCGLCSINCPAAAQPEERGAWLQDECFGCWNCVASCKQGGLEFAFEPPWRKPQAARVSLTRRAVLRSATAGVGGLLLFRIAPQARGATYNPELVRPPGAAAEPDFLARCIQCGECMKICPTNALHPTFLEAGFEGIWTPRLDARIGYCDYECNLCGQVCPTAAIEPLTVEDKKQVRIGLATVDTTRCLPYAYARECIVCEEHCPISDKAIYFVEVEVVQRDGTTRLLKQPRVDPSKCTGCGICENKCPFRDRAAIRVTSANESRHPDNQPIL
jgi:MauM/NapG family ferredoxin protein